MDELNLHYDIERVNELIEEYQSTESESVHGLILLELLEETVWKDGYAPDEITRINDDEPGGYPIYETLMDKIQEKLEDHKETFDGSTLRSSE